MLVFASRYSCLLILSFHLPWPSCTLSPVANSRLSGHFRKVCVDSPHSEQQGGALFRFSDCAVADTAAGATIAAVAGPAPEAAAEAAAAGPAAEAAARAAVASARSYAT